MTDWREKGKASTIELMKEIRAWKPFGLFLVATPIALLTGLMSAGAGHGDYLLVKILFPYTMLSTVFLNAITIPALFLAIVQFPIYGLILSIVTQKKFAALILTAIHVSLAILSLVLIGENFS